MVATSDPKGILTTELAEEIGRGAATGLVVQFQSGKTAQLPRYTDSQYQGHRGNVASHSEVRYRDNRKGTWDKKKAFPVKMDSCPPTLIDKF